MYFLRRLILFFARFGFMDGMIRIANYFFSFVYCNHEQVLLIKEISTTDITQPENIPDVVVRPLRLEDIGKVVGALYTDTNVVRERLKAGDVCVIAIADGRIASSCWVLFRFAELPALDLKLPLPDKTAFEDTLVTDKSYRRKGYGRMVMREIERISTQRGFKNIILAINVDNTASRNLFDGLGYRIFKQVRMIRLLGVRRYVESVIIPEYSSLIDTSS